MAGTFLYIPDSLSIHTFENGFTDLETTLRSNRKHIFCVKTLVYSNKKHTTGNLDFRTDAFANRIFTFYFEDITI